MAGQGPSPANLKLNSRQTAELLRPYRFPDNATNFKWLALEYATLLLVAGGATTFMVQRASWGLSWWWNVPVAGAAIILMGGLQHRLAGLAHEAAHYCLFRNRLLNELISDLFCMFPILATTHQYRLVHTAHHQYVNDWEKDPDLTNIGDSKLMHAFPMTRKQFFYNYFLRFFYPPALLRYLWDVLSLSVLGQGHSPYLERSNDGPSAPTVFGVRWVSLLGAVYLFAVIGVLATLNNIWDASPTTLLAVAGAMLAGALATTVLLPQRLFFQSPLNPVYSAKTTGAMRLAYYTAVLTACAIARSWTGINFGGYVVLLWGVPLLTTFSYFMLLRDVYQHANADAGRLTNTRVFRCDPFTAWAVFVYGQGYHSPHHLFPAIPHYNLRAVHELLKQCCPEYSASVVECHGTFFNRGGQPTVLDVIAPKQSPRQPWDEDSSELPKPVLQQAAAEKSYV